MSALQMTENVLFDVCMCVHVYTTRTLPPCTGRMQFSDSDAT